MAFHSVIPTEILKSFNANVELYPYSFLSSVHS